MTKTEELLKVLDLPEDEQVRFLELRSYSVAEIGGGGVTYRYESHDKNAKVIEVFRRDGKPLRFRKRNLADLTFNLRDEAVAKNLHGYPSGYMECQRIVWIHVINPSQYDDIPSDKGSGNWWAYYAQPIHWVIASLIAKELAEDGN